MAEEFIKFSFDKKFKKQIEDYLYKKQNAITQRIRTKLLESAEFVKEKMIQYAPRDSGNLSNIIKSLPIRSNGIKVSFNENSSMKVTIDLNRRKDLRILWADRGTGIYGPTRRVIRPTNGEFMYFEVNGQLIRTRTVKGQKAKRFIRSAVNASKLIIVSKLRSALKEA